MALEQLPDELLLKVLSFLYHEELCTVSEVSKKFRRLAFDPTLWKHIVLEEWPRMSLECWRLLVSRCTLLTSLYIVQQGKNTPELLRAVAESPHGRQIRHLKIFEQYWLGEDDSDGLITAAMSISRLTWLETLDLELFRFLDLIGLRQVLSSCRKLKKLNLQCLEHLDSDTFKYVCERGAENLIYLSVNKDLLKDADMSCLAQLTNLQHLSILHKRVEHSDEDGGRQGGLGPLAFGALCQLTKLTTLELEEVQNISDLRGQKLHQLKTLKVMTSFLRDRDLLELVRHMPGLEQLSLGSLPLVTDSGLTQAFAACTSIRALHILWAGPRVVGTFLEGLRKLLPQLRLMSFTSKHTDILEFQQRNLDIEFREKEGTKWDEICEDMENFMNRKAYEIWAAEEED
jgi:Leucine-rich repeat (LRR) protein